MAPPAPQQQQQPKAPDHIDTKLIDLGNGKGRILCIADIRGDIEQLNRLVRESGAVACIHTGDFGLYDRQSVDRISDKTLKHLVTYSPLLTPALRAKLLAPSLPRRELVQALAPNADDFHLSQFPLLFGSTPRLRLIVPTFVVYGACEDVRVVERFRTGEYALNNLTVLDEATTRAVDVGGVRLRLLGLGGAVVMAKMFDNGEGNATIAGGQGTMWTTALQIGELVDTAQRVYDPTETRILITHASLGREPLLSLLALALKADLTISSGLHFRYGAGWNEFSVQDEGGGGWWGKVTRGRKRWDEVWGMVRAQVEAVIEPAQRVYLDKTLAVFARAPPAGGPNAGPSAEESAWKNTWSWNLTDSTFGQLVLDVEDGKVGAEMRSQGFNFSHRRAAPALAAAAGAAAPTPAPAAPKGLAVPRTAGVASPASVGQQHQQQQQPPTGPKGRKTPVGGQPEQRGASPAPTTPNGGGGGGAPKIELKPLAGGGNNAAGAQHKKTESAASAAAKGLSIKGASSASPGPASSDAAGPPASPSSPAAAGRKATSGPQARQPMLTAFVNGLPVPVSEVELRDLFGDAKAGIASVRFMFDGKGDQKKFAYVTFKDLAAFDAGVAASVGRQIRGATPKAAAADPSFVAAAGIGSASGGSGSEWGGSARAGRGGKKNRGGEGAKARKAAAAAGSKGSNGESSAAEGGAGAPSAPAAAAAAPAAAAAAAAAPAPAPPAGGEAKKD